MQAPAPSTDVLEKKYVSMENLRFILFEVFQAEKLAENPYFAEYDKESIELMVASAKQIADTHMFPIFQEMDQFGSNLEDGVLKVHPGLRDIIDAMGEGGWIGAQAPAEVGGMQMPSMVYMAAEFIFNAANNSAVGYSGLTAGAAKLIYSFGSQALIDTYVDRMLGGEWQGTMALTEPQAGSSLSDVITSATPTEEGHYMIEGQKIFISSGDHDATNNVIHLMLARIEGAPAGTKGISLFVVPKYRLDESGQLVDNDVQTAAAIHKMGQSGYSNVQLMMGEKANCRGYLVGEPHRGLRYMFQMMNGARLGVGMSATGTASGAYYASLKYAYERAQGRRLNNRDLSKPQDLIAHHPDVRRMLFLQKAIVEGCLSLVMQCAQYADMMKITEGDERERNHQLLEILIGIAKTYPSEAGNRSVSNGLQVLGGYGYVKDFPLEQYYRDMRIMAIYEGTTGIQSQDLLGRKVILGEGQMLKKLMVEVQETMAEAAQLSALQEHVGTFKKVLEELGGVTQHLMGIAMKGDKEVFLSDANLYMEVFSNVVIGWQWLKQGIVAARALENPADAVEDKEFYESKLHTLAFYFAYELPRNEGLIKRLMDPRIYTVLGTDKDLLR